MKFRKNESIIYCDPEGYRGRKAILSTILIIAKYQITTKGFIKALKCKLQCIIEIFS